MFQEPAELIIAGQVQDPIDIFKRWPTPPICPNSSPVLHLPTRRFPLLSSQMANFNHKFKACSFSFVFRYLQDAAYRLGLDHWRGFVGTFHIPIPPSTHEGCLSRTSGTLLTRLWRSSKIHGSCFLEARIHLQPLQRLRFWTQSRQLQTLRNLCKPLFFSTLPSTRT